MTQIITDVWDVTTHPLDPTAALSFVTAAPNGAEVVFVGTVRDHNQGKQVLGVSYDVFDPLAIKTFNEICAEAQEKWGRELRLYVVHGKGRLDIGGVSIVIGAGSPHRDEAFQACRYLIDEIKHRSPIWKLEHYVDGDSEWAQGCELCSRDHDHAAHEHRHA